MAFVRKSPAPTNPHDRPEKGGEMLGEFHRARVDAAIKSVAVPPLGQDPKYEGAAQIARVLQNARELAEAERDLLMIESAHSAMTTPELMNPPGANWRSGGRRR
jgi:hypothetical protein